MGQTIYQVDAFTNRAFAGNPAAVCILPAPAPEAWMRDVAREMNLANDPDFFGVKGPIPHRSLDDPNVRASVVGELQGSVIVASQAPLLPMPTIDFPSALIAVASDSVQPVKSIPSFGR